MEAVVQGRIAGAALLVSLVSIVVGLLVVAVQGNLGGLSAGFRGIEGIGKTAVALSVMAKAGFPYILLQLVGFGILAVMLRNAGQGLLATLSFAVLVFASAVSVFRGAFEGTVTVWAAQELAATGSVPDLYEPLHAWTNEVFEIAYASLLMAMAGFGWAVLQTELLAHWVGWISIGWSVLWLLGYLFGVGIPAIIALYPLVYGIALLGVRSPVGSVGV
jgi:hypothetical protein